MPDSLWVGIVLQADVAGERALLIVRPRIYEPAVEADRIIQAGASQFVAVPLAERFHGHFDRAVERIDRSRPTGRLRWLRITDLHLVALLDRHPRIIPRIRESDEHAGIRVRPFLYPFATQHEVGERPAGEPPQPHAFVSGRDAILNCKMPRPALRPAIRGVFAEEV